MIFLGILLLLVQIFLLIYFTRQQNEFLKDISFALGLSSWQKKSWSLWHKTIKKSDAMLGQAELEGVKIVADTKYHTKVMEEKMDQVFAASLDKAIADFVGKLSARLDTQADFYKKQMADKASGNIMEILDEVTKTAIGKKLSYDDQIEMITQGLKKSL